MATITARKNGHELAAAWLRRDPTPGRTAPATRGPAQPKTGKPGEISEAASQAALHLGRTKGFFRA